ncbi:transglycosylase SLT domain-containing protein [Pseudomonas sp. PS01301]|uniref:transglycosylase SLT domain-containing protein n=1 Tax=Pseudomonas sp. PS01301 TaxID=2991437 RepID=UPI00249BF815|nr:transglycosylase SLT domain-containing protein [Pseudomonas sp. PS01301]
MTMKLNADESGFLVAAGRVNLDQDRQRLTLLRAIKADTSAMRQALAKSATPRGSTTQPLGPAPSAGMSARARRIAPREAANEAATEHRAVTRDRAEGARQRRQSETRQARQAQATARPQRDGKGRFLGKGDQGDQGGAEARRTGGKLLARFGALLGKAKGAFAGSGSGEAVDPSITAAREFGSILSPITRPFKGMASLLFRRRNGDSEQKVAVPWYRRIWSELRGINQKSGSRGGSMLGKLGGLLGAIPGVGLIGRGAKGMFGGGRRGEVRSTGVPRRAGARERLKRMRDSRTARTGGSPLRRGTAAVRDKVAKGANAVGGALGKGVKGAGNALGGLAKRVPLLGTVLAGGKAIGGMLGLGDQTREERFSNTGGGVGALIGGAAGTLLGPIGTMVGGMVGDMVGTKVGQWLSTVDWSDVSAQMTGTWDKAAGKIGDGWALVQGKFTTALDTVSQTFTNLKQSASQAITTAANWTGNKYTQAKQAAAQTATQAKEWGTKKLESVQGVATKATAAVKSAAGGAYEAATIEGGRLVGSLNPKYRHKETFAGIKGGEQLAKYGTYTNDEAARIRELKSTGANTSANLKGGMPPAIRNKIIAQAKLAGLDPDEMLQVAALESGGNPNAISGTGATGVFQMTGQTATGLGITDRFDADQNIAGGMLLGRQNKAALQRAGLPVNRDSLYMMHQLGPTAATEMLRGAAMGKSMSELSAGTQKAASLNYGKGAATAKDYLAKNSKALDSRLAQVSGGTTGVPSTLAAPASAAPTAPALPAVASAAAPIERQQLAPAPTVPRKVGDNSKKPEVPMFLAPPITQNVSDRGLAQAATGGLGMNLGAR